MQIEKKSKLIPQILNVYLFGGYHREFTMNYNVKFATVALFILHFPFTRVAHFTASKHCQNLRGGWYIDP